MPLDLPISHEKKIKTLIRNGVNIPDPNSLFIGDEVSIDRISAKEGVFFPGMRIFGKNSFIAHGAQIGREGPVTIENCQIGPQVALKSGYFSDAVFLSNSSCGSGSHVRKGTLLEEEASIAHTVGLKQTILFPYVTLGSLINFCDCLMAGGTDSKNHSEVGSSFIHFNFTANQDKATASLIGDVPFGVMLNQPPIFLGGQGGLVGPSRIAYGTVLAAGSICRKDQLKPNLLIFEGTAGRGSMPYKTGSFRNIKRVLNNNLYYIGNLISLWHWYRHVRSLFIGVDYPQPLAEGAQQILTDAINERFHQLNRLAEKIETAGIEGELQKRFCEYWPSLQTDLQMVDHFQGEIQCRNEFVVSIKDIVGRQGTNYLDCIKGLDSNLSGSGTAWLVSIINQFMDKVKGKLEL